MNQSRLRTLASQSPEPGLRRRLQVACIDHDEAHSILRVARPLQELSSFFSVQEASPTKRLSPREISSLGSFLSSKDRPDGTLSFHELQGFLFAVTSSPQLIMPSDWFPLISDDEDIGYADLDEAEKISGLIMALYNEINTAVMQRRDTMPTGCEFLADTSANFDAEAPVSQWSRGFMLGHDWLSEVWDEYIPDESSEMSEELGACTMTLSFFASKELAEAYYLEGRGRRRRIDPKEFRDLAEKIRGLFPSALASYAHLGRTISEVLATSQEH